MNNLNILHYTFGLPPKATGGLPLYVKDLSESQKSGPYCKYTIAKTKNYWKR